METKEKLSNSEMVVGAFQTASGAIFCYYYFSYILILMNTEHLPLPFARYFNAFFPGTMLSLMTIISGIFLLFSKNRLDYGDNFNIFYFG